MNDTVKKQIGEWVKIAQTTDNAQEKAEVIEKIIKKLKPFRFALARRFSNKGVEFDDIVQTIDLMIIEAIHDYDHTKDPNALRHLTAKARNGLWNFYRKEMNYFREDISFTSLDSIAWDLDDSNFDYHGVVAGKDFNEDAILDRIVVEEELAKLTPRQKEILFMHFVEDMTQYVVAEELNINQANVSRALKRGLKTIKENITPSDEQSDKT